MNDIPHTPSLRSLLGSFAFLTSVFLVSCSSMDDYDSLPAESFIPTPKGQLSAGDLIEISYPGAPELNLKQKILANGQVNLPIIGDVPAANKRLGQFQKELETRYTKHLTDPRILVSLETTSAVVYVSGEVETPGKVPLERPLTVLEAIVESGGFSRFANQGKIQVYRTENGERKSYLRNLANNSIANDHQPFYLKPYDVVVVHKSLW